MMNESEKNTAAIKSPPRRSDPNRKKSLITNSRRILRQKKLERIKASLFLFLTFYFLLILVSVVLFVFNLNYVSNNTKKVGLQVQYTENTKKNYSADSVFIGDALYVPYDAFSKLCPAVITGDSDKITIILSSGNDYCTLYKDSRFIYIGNVQFALNAPVLFMENDYYIPFEVFDKFTNGISIEFDSKRQRYVMASGDESVSFIGKFQEIPERIKVSDIP